MQAHAVREPGAAAGPPPEGVAIRPGTLDDLEALRPLLPVIWLHQRDSPAFTGYTLPDEDRSTKMPLLGNIAAGSPIEAVENREELDLEAALNDFVRHAMPLDSDVSVQFGQGIASLHGTVPSLTVAQAIEDLVLAHDGVQSVINGLSLAPVSKARAEESRPSA